MSDGGGGFQDLPDVEGEDAEKEPSATWYTAGGKAAPEGGNALISKLQGSLARIQIGDETLDGLPPPPESPAAVAGLTAAGVLLSLVGVVILGYFLTSLQAPLYCLGLGLIGWGAIVILYAQWHGSLSKKALPNHRSSSPEELRTVWECAMTMAVVLAMGNFPTLLLISWVIQTFLHWTLALLVVVSFNILMALAAYRGDGTNRRPLLPAATGGPASPQS